jgi:hypothetical protein
MDAAAKSKDKEGGDIIHKLTLMQIMISLLL